MKAFPSEAGPKDAGTYMSAQSGMDLRDYFAAKILQGLFANPHIKVDLKYQDLCELSYEIADGMMWQREQES